MKRQCDGGVRNRHGEAHGHADHGAQFNVDVCLQHIFSEFMSYTSRDGNRIFLGLPQLFTSTLESSLELEI